MFYQVNILLILGPVSPVGQPTTGRPGPPLPTVNAATFRQYQQQATSATARPHTTTTTRPGRLADSGAGHKFPHFPSTELTDVRSSYQQQTGTYTERSPTYDYEEVCERSYIPALPVSVGRLFCILF
jgi:hypothetical protein